METLDDRRRIDPDPLIGDPMREFVMGVEALETFVRGAPLPRCMSAGPGCRRSKANLSIRGCSA